MLPAVEEDLTISSEARAEKQVFIGKLTKCWSDCAGVVVVEQNSAVSFSRIVLDSLFIRLTLEMYRMDGHHMLDRLERNLGKDYETN